MTYTFNDEVTGVSVNSYWHEDGKTHVYHIEAWKTLWDTYIIKHQKAQASFYPEDGKEIAIYYTQNNGAEDVLIYGSAPYGSGGIMTLPRLVLGYYLIIAMIASIVLAIPLIIFRKKHTAKLWLERILLFPISYIISHFCVMSVKDHLSISYSMQHDFSFILLVTMLVYLAGLLGLSIIRARKDGGKD